MSEPTNTRVPQYTPLHASTDNEGGSEEAAARPAWWASILDVDDAPMLQKRDMVMNVCLVQIVLSFALVTNYRRSPVLLILQPFFIGAGALGYFGAKKSHPLYVASHFMGSAGLALVFLFFILAETLLKNTQGQVHANADLFFIVINMPMDLFLFASSVASVILYLSLRQLRGQLRQRRDHIRERFEAMTRGEGVPGGRSGVPAGVAGIELTDAGVAAENRRRHGWKQDLRCPITLEIMYDPVIASDGHSYEREAIERWLAGHRTSPVTGRVLPAATLIPNHRLRTLSASTGFQLAPLAGRDPLTVRGARSYESRYGSPRPGAGDGGGGRPAL